MIQREFTAERVNAVLNDPRVRPWVADESEGRLDISATIENRANVLLMGQWGGCMFFCLQHGMYEVHTQVLPEGRGDWARRMVQEAAFWMFTRTDAYEILTRVPRGHVAARTLTAMMGRYEFTRPQECKFRGRTVDVDIWGTRIQDWVLNADGLTERGRWFHDRLHQEAARLGIDAPAHEDDENHNRYVGAALEMARQGQIVKAVLFYNRWAAVSRHPLIALVSQEPPLVRFDIGLLRFVGNDIEVVREN